VEGIQKGTVTMNPRLYSEDVLNVLAEALLKIRAKTGEELIDVVQFVLLHLSVSALVAGVPKEAVVELAEDAVRIAEENKNKQAEEHPSNPTVH